MKKINFRKAWNMFKEQTLFVSKNKELEIIYKIKEVQGIAHKSGFYITDEHSVNKAMIDLESKGEKITIAKVLIHKTEF